MNLDQKRIQFLTFEETKIRDQIKNKFCLDNNIRLIRISYKDIDKIEEILTKELPNEST